jgi:rubrerythrin
MTSIKNSKTETNLLAAFAGESRAQERYTSFAIQAKKEGYVQIARLFNETAGQEKEHAKRLLYFLESDSVPAATAGAEGKIESTEKNLATAAAGEREEHEHMYPNFAKIAQSEGFEKIAAAMGAIAVAERHHEERFLALLRELREGSLFQKKKEVLWECLNCGYRHRGTGAPDICPACAHPKAYFVSGRTF